VSQDEALKNTVGVLSGVASAFLVNELFSKTVKSWSPKKRRVITGAVLCGGGVGVAALKNANTEDVRAPLLFSLGAAVTLGVDALCAPKSVYVHEPVEGEKGNEQDVEIARSLEPPLRPDVTPERADLLVGDPQRNLTKDFKLYQFACPRAGVPPLEYIPNVERLAKNLQVLKDFLGLDITFANGGTYRSPQFNASIGGAKNSMHMFAKAADIKVPGQTPAQVKAAIEALISRGMMEEGGLGIYNTFVHYDVRGHKSRWDERR